MSSDNVDKIKELLQSSGAEEVHTKSFE